MKELSNRDLFLFFWHSKVSVFLHRSTLLLQTKRVLKQLPKNFSARNGRIIKQYPPPTTAIPIKPPLPPNKIDCQTPMSLQFCHYLIPIHQQARKPCPFSCVRRMKSNHKQRYSEYWYTNYPVAHSFSSS